MDTLPFIAWFVSLVSLMLSWKITNVRRKPASDTAPISQWECRKPTSDTVWTSWNILDRIGHRHLLVLLLVHRVLSSVPCRISKCISTGQNLCVLFVHNFSLVSESLPCLFPLTLLQDGLKPYSQQLEEVMTSQLIVPVQPLLLLLSVRDRHLQLWSGSKRVVNFPW